MRLFDDVISQLSQQLKELEPYPRGKELTCSRRDKGLVFFQGRELLDLTSWDILGLSYHPALKYALQREVEVQGFGSGTSRVGSGGSFEHFLAEDRLAKFLGQEESLFFSTRNQALLSLVTSIFGEGDVLLVEEGVLSAVTDAAYLVDAEVQTFCAEDLDTLTRLCSQLSPHTRRGVFVEPISPIRGRKVPLATISAICERYKLGLFVDETYSLGVLGARGAGGVEGAGVPHMTSAIVGSLAHALAGYGGFVAGPSVLIAYLLRRSRTLRTETSLPAAIAKWVERALDVVEGATLKRAALGQLAQQVAQAVVASGCGVSQDSESPVIVCHFRAIAEARSFHRGLMERGFLVFEPIVSGVKRSISVPLVLRVWHTEQQIRNLCQAINDVTVIVRSESRTT